MMIQREVDKPCEMCGEMMLGVNPRKHYCTCCLRIRKTESARIARERDFVEVVCDICGKRIVGARANTKYCAACREAVRMAKKAEKAARKREDYAAHPGKYKAMRGKYKADKYMRHIVKTQPSQVRLAEHIREADRLGVSYGVYMADYCKEK